MKNRRRLLFIRNDGSSNNTHKPPKDIDFMSWKAELNSELLSFWKTIEENIED